MIQASGNLRGYKTPETVEEKLTYLQQQIERY